MKTAKSTYCAHTAGRWEWVTACAACGAKALGKRQNFVSFAMAALILVGTTTTAHTATIALDLTCSLNGLNSSGSCSAGPSFGTVTLEDLTGVDAGKVEVTVDLGFASSQKFRDLILNYSGSASSIADNDPNNAVFLSNNNVNFSISPYSGRFDVGATDQQGWNAATSGPYTTILSGDVALSTSDFITLDSLGNLYAALHIQDIGSATGGECDGTNNPACMPGMPGPGSLKIGAPDFRIVQHQIPEPSSLTLLILLSLISVCRRR